MAGRPRNFTDEEVLEKAMLPFWKKGYDATGLVDLEKATGLGRQSLYGAFGDKRALFGHVVEHYFNTVLRPGLIDVLDNPESGGRANIESVFAAWEALVQSPEFNGCLVGNSVAELSGKDEELAGVLRRKLSLMEEAFYRALKRAQKSGELAKGVDLRGTARSLITTAQGLAVVARVQRDPAFVRGVIQAARRLLDP